MARCTSRDDPTRLNHTWAWSSDRCPGNTPNINNCPNGFKGDIGRSENSDRSGDCSWFGCRDCCADCTSRMNRAKCYKYGSYNTPSNELILNCCIGGVINPYECPAEYCSDNTQNNGLCAGVLAVHCNRNDNIVKDVRCQRLKNNVIPEYRTLYNELIDNYCLKDKPDLEKMSNPACQVYCKENPNECRPTLENLCRLTYPTEENPYPTHSATCGCYYDPRVYSSFYGEMSRQLNLPGGILDTQPACYYPNCANAIIKPTVDCKDVNISQCIQDTTIYANGATIGRIDVRADCNIPGLSRRQSSVCNPPCNDGYECTNATCTLDKCAATCDYENGEICRDGVCTVAPATTPFNKTTIIIIIAIILFICILCSVGFSIFASKHSTTNDIGVEHFGGYFENYYTDYYSD